MTRATMSLGLIATGVALVVAGIYGWFGKASLTLAAAGLVGLLVGIGGLLSTQSRSNLRRPHVAIYCFISVAVAFHVFQNLRVSSDFALGWFLWGLTPYGLVLALSFFQSVSSAAVAAAVLALIFDAWSLYGVVRSTSSTAVLAFIWVPIWNTIIVVPIATFLAWLWACRRGKVSTDVP